LKPGCGCGADGLVVHSPQRRKGGKRDARGHRRRSGMQSAVEPGRRGPGVLSEPGDGAQRGLAATGWRGPVGSTPLGASCRIRTAASWSVAALPAQLSLSRLGPAARRRLAGCGPSTASSRSPASPGAGPSRGSGAATGHPGGIGGSAAFTPTPTWMAAGSGRCAVAGGARQGREGRRGPAGREEGTTEPIRSPRAGRYDGVGALISSVSRP